MRPTPTLALLLAACASRPVPVPESTSTPTPVAVPAPESATGSEAVTEAVTAEPARVSIPAIDAVVSGAIAEGKLPGAVVTVGRSSGILFQRAYGHRSLVPERTPMTEDVIFDLASLTKPLVTAALVHKLAEERKLGLGDPIARHLPELDGKRTGEITILQLLLHSSGLPRVTRLRDYELPREQALATLLATRTEHRPGARYLYGDVAYLWLGVLIERVAGVPLDRLAREHLFQPLGLSHTRFRPPADWLPRIAPTERTDKRPSPLIHGVVHDPRAYRLGGVAGNAGLFSTADDLARLARTLLQRGSLDGQRVLSAHSVDTMTRPHPVGTRTVRTPGWDVRSDYDTHRGSRLSPAAYGHGGYTGVSLWIDPQLDLFVLFLSNRVHPDGDGNVLQLAGDVADAAVAAIAPTATCPPPDAPVLPGIDTLRAADFAPLRGKRVGLVTHLAAVARDGTPTLDILAAAPEVELAALFTPEHGLESAREGAIEGGHDPTRDLPIHSLFGKTRKPTAAMLDGIDMLVVDLFDVGTRFYTYASTVHQVMRGAAEHGVPVLILDRPNPLGGLAVEGPVLDPDVRTFVNYHRLPVRHGLTLGELAALVAAEKNIAVSLGVVPATAWRRGALHADTGLPFRAPSPNLRDAHATLLYPAVGLLESTNLSVGRGTDAPFALLGAPWLEHGGLLAALQGEGLPGLEVALAEFTPSARPHRGQPCKGLRLRVTDPRTFRPVDTALGIARALARLHPGQWTGKDLQRLLAHRRSHRAVLRGAPLSRIARLYERELAEFRARRARYLRYPTCPDAAAVDSGD